MDFSGLIEGYKNELIENVQKLVRIESIEGTPDDGMPFGRGPAEALGYALDLGKKLGFAVKNVDNYAGHIEYGDGDEIVGVLAHVDTVPVGDGWTMDPFCGTVAEGKIYGRGSYDDKGACIASIYALNALKESGVKLKKKVRLIFGANEETGMKDIPHYLTKEKEPDMAFSPDSPFPVIYGEKGILNLRFEKKIRDRNCVVSLKGGTSPKFVPAECTVKLDIGGDEAKQAVESLTCLKGRYGYNYCFDENSLLSVTVCGKSANGTRPYEGVNAVAGMMRYLSELNCIDGDMRQLVNLFNANIGEETDGRSLECNFTDDISTPLTLNVGMVSMDKDNIAFDIHIRYPVTVSYTSIFGNLTRNLTCGNAVVEIREHSPAHYVSEDSQLVNTLMNIYRNATGDSEAKPATMEGGTYARTLKNAVAFGPLFPGEKQVAHGPDEYVNIDSLIKAAKIYAEALYELSK